MFEIDNNAHAPVAALWREHSQALLGYATILIGPSDANDIVVEAFMRAAPAVARGDVDQPRAWFIRAVTNQAHDLRRARQRRWKRDLAALTEAAATETNDFVDVQRAVAALSLSQRAVVYLAYWEDMSERSIADLLQLSPGTIRRHLVRARIHLRKALNDV